MNSSSRWWRRSLGLLVAVLLLGRLVLALAQGPRAATNVHVNAGAAAACASGTIGDTTIGTLTLAATLTSISVTAAYSGDATANATAALAYRQTGSTTWRDAYAPYIDRRTALGGVANPYVNQARGAVVGLTENTAYDVKVTWTDSSASACASASVTTETSAPPTGSGSARAVTDNTTQASALAAANPGDTLTWSAGSYNAFTLSRSGNAGAWIVLDGGGVATINGAGVNQNIQISADYILLKNFLLSASDFTGISLGGRTHVIVSGTTVQGFSTGCAGAGQCVGGLGSHCADAGITIGNGASTILLLENTIAGSTNIAASCFQASNFDGPGEGINFPNSGTCTTCIVRGNTIVGNGARDGITSDNSTGILINTDIYNNTVSGYVDDGIEPKGQNLNVRIWGNTITENGAGTKGGDSVWSNESTLSTNTYGPTYFFRNVGVVTKTDGTNRCLYKGPAGPTFILHNSITANLSPTTFNWDINCGNGVVAANGPYVVLNNASLVTGLMIEGGGKTPAANGVDVFDYNCGTTTGSWAGSWGPGNTTYTTFALFQAGTGQESHTPTSAHANPSFADTALHLNSSSPCIDIGVAINNFNDASSAWAFLGAAPDAGALEKQ